MFTFSIRTPRGTTQPLTREDGQIICESGDAIFEEVHAMLAAERNDTSAQWIGSFSTTKRERRVKQYALATIGLSDEECF